MPSINIGTSGQSCVGGANVIMPEVETWFDDELGQMPSLFEDIPDPDPPAPVTEISFIFCTG